MKLKITLVASTALALLASTGFAFAASNFALVNQIGSDNSADVLQDGTSNQTRILQGTLAAPGDNNIAIIDQDGTGNLAGFQAYSDSQWTLRQYGNNNLIDIEQDGRSNEVGQDNGARYGGRSHNVSFGGVGVQQTGSYNVIDITQSNAANTYSQNAVGAIRQNSAIGASAVTNELIIDQTDSPATAVNGPRHYVGFVTQTNTGAGNAAALKNLVNILQSGGGHPNPNGLDGHHVYNLSQNGTANIVDIDQYGHTHRIGTIAQTGDSNEIDIDQTVFSNRISLLTQTGADNYAKVVQNGSGNVLVSMVQDSSASAAGGNYAALDFQGSDNGISASGLNGFSTGGNADGLGLTQGTVLQTGGNNSLTYNVTSDANLFAFKQNGDDNTIIGSVSTGDGNEVAVLQDGNGNTANFTQSGGGNNISISQ